MRGGLWVLVPGGTFLWLGTTCILLVLLCESGECFLAPIKQQPIKDTVGSPHEDRSVSMRTQCAHRVTCRVETRGQVDRGGGHLGAYTETKT